MRITREIAESNLQISEQTLRISQEGQISNSFTRAIEQLGNQSNLASRLGGIYALEQIAKNSQEYNKPIVELLTAFVREHSRWKEADSVEAERAGLDIQTILTVLGRRTRLSQGDDPRNPLNLIATNLRLITLIDSHFEHAVFARSNLQGAFLSDSHFEEASFRKCNMKKAVMERTQLGRANFTDANMEGANLLEAQGKQANFVMARLQGACFTRGYLKGAQFIRANLVKAYFDEAVLRGANFVGADLQEVDFTKACLVGADLVGTNLKDANLEGADLSDAHGLSLEQLKSTYGYGNAILPNYLKIAMQSEQETERQG
ncbi:MAG TPA: pentapeptide repeat-containing protein [Pyrinomonadaceae bacterium]|nr:pentapeptide repeat-containing protein [Pyrinomonadaceae bacterium]